MAELARSITDFCFKLVSRLHHCGAAERRVFQVLRCGSCAEKDVNNTRPEALDMNNISGHCGHGSLPCSGLFA